MQITKQRTRLLSLALSLAMLFTLLPLRAWAAGIQPPVPVETVSTNFFSKAVYLDFGFQNSAWIDKIQTLSVDGVPYQEGGSSLSMKSGTYVRLSSDGRIMLPPNLPDTVKCTIQAEGYEDLHLKLDVRNQKVTVISAADAGSSTEQRDPAGAAASLERVLSVYLKLTITGLDRYVDGITAIRCVSSDQQPVELRPVSYKPLLNGPTYYLDAAESAIYFDAMNPVLHSGDILTISSSQYQDLRLKITLEEGAYRAEVVGDETPQPGGEQTLHVRLVGSFEPALVDQKGYDAVTGATSTVTVNKNSSVEVQCALTNKDAAPTDSDWLPLHKSGVTVRRDQSAVEISPQGSGMTGVYSTLDSALTLSGTPAMKGEYQISVTITDDQGRKAVSNSLPFLVYSGDEKLVDRLTLDHATQAQDGKYLYDMVPWAIRDFGGENETVTVPAQIKAWFGSHTSGTYGKLGYALPNGQEPVQTLLIPAGCDLTLVNMDVLSSVKMVVQSGGKLTLQDSAVQGVIQVEQGGTFSMNYDSYHGKFLTGASINGQLRLMGGAVLENAAIYSNTNFIANGSQARKNTQPVVAVLGDVTVKGQVFIKGDEAPTGTDPLTGRSYAGQTGLSVTGGTLTLADDALLAVYGGGMQAATSVGGTAVLLENGAIAGSGTLLAVGGDGTFDRGGDAVSGTGTVSAAKAYLQGGAAAFPKSGDITGGKAAAAGVNAPNAVKHDGVTWKSEGENPHIPRWSGASAAPSKADADKTIAYISAQAGHSPEIPGQQDPSVPQTAYYPVNAGTVPHGTLKLSALRAPRGRTVTVTVKPDEGYALQELQIQDRAGKTVKVTEKSPTQYTFTMPASPVKITAAFKEKTPDNPAPTPEQPTVEKEVSFRDVSKTDYYYEAVRWAVKENVTQGADQNRFAPDAHCTRAQAVTFLWRASGSPAPKNRTLPFRDVGANDFYYDAVCWAVEQGITGGTGANTFSPDAEVTRSQTVAFLHRAAGSPAAGKAAAFSDVDNGSYYAGAVNWAVEHGVTQGTGGGSFSPELVCTRAQMVSLLHRSVEQKVFSW
ncbi:S-layer homology domain-containing protein [Flavonifractor porci]|uniref:S-layer homology domain-containing protein n=1 Tax=Flavonifractor porci TaxID=3133422 RepID=UPI0030B3B788